MKIENSYPGIDGISMLTNGLSYLGNEFACVRGPSSEQLLRRTSRSGQLQLPQPRPAGQIAQVALSATIAQSHAKTLGHRTSRRFRPHTGEHACSV